MIFNNKADSIFNNYKMEDKNLSNKCFELDIQIKDILFIGNTRKDYHLMNFLIKNFTSDEIIELFESIDEKMIKSGLAVCTIQIFRKLDKSLIYDEFKHTNNNFMDIYNELTRLKLIERDWLKNRLFIRLSGINNEYYNG